MVLVPKISSWPVESGKVVLRNEWNGALKTAATSFASSRGIKMLSARSSFAFSTLLLPLVCSEEPLEADLVS